MSRFLSSCRWGLPLVLLLLLLSILRPQQDAPHAEPAERQNLTAAKQAAALDAFDAWVTDGRQSEAVARGLELARERRVALKELIQVDPRAALEHAVPYAERRRLPQAAWRDGLRDARVLRARVRGQSALLRDRVGPGLRRRRDRSLRWHQLPRRRRVPVAQ